MSDPNAEQQAADALAAQRIAEAQRAAEAADAAATAAAQLTEGQQ
ncbi:hypothetical protein ABZ802_31460 [Streptomyces sp. NPDC047737]